MNFLDTTDDFAAGEASRKAVPHSNLGGGAKQRDNPLFSRQAIAASEHLQGAEAFQMVAMALYALPTTAHEEANHSLSTRGQFVEPLLAVANPLIRLAEGATFEKGVKVLSGGAQASAQPRGHSLLKVAQA